MDISIVIPFVDRVELLRNLLVSISESKVSELSHILIIIDDRCPKVMLDLLADQYAAKLIFSDCYTASSKRNVGLRKAKSEWVLFLDDDVVIERTLIQKYSDIITEKENNRCRSNKIFAGPVLFSGKTQGAKMFLASRFAGAFDLSKGSRVVKEWVVSANMCVNRYFALLVGGFDDNWNIPAGGEDIDFCLRWSKSGGVIEYVNDCIVHHSDVSLTPWFNMRRAYYYGRGEAKLISTHSDRHKFYIRPELYIIAGAIITAVLYHNTTVTITCILGVLISPLVFALIKYKQITTQKMKYIENIVHESYMFFFFTIGKIAEAVSLRRIEIIFRGFLFHISSTAENQTRSNNNIYD